jgi:hypothetical protein
LYLYNAEIPFVTTQKDCRRKSTTLELDVNDTLSGIMVSAGQFDVMKDCKILELAAP